MGGNLLILASSLLLSVFQHDTTDPAHPPISVRTRYDPSRLLSAAGKLRGDLLLQEAW